MAFAQLEWNRLDVQAIVGHRGVATILQHDRDRAKNWLTTHGYAVLEFDFADGIAAMVTQFGQALQWQKQFGYELSGEVANLDAIADGFSALPGAGALVMMFDNVDSMYSAHSEWVLGFAAIIADASLAQLAVGARFFSLWSIPSGHSTFVGQVIAQSMVGVPLRF
jgi:hypothetical protein